MRFLPPGLLSGFLLLLSACAAAPPSVSVVSHDPALSRQQGVLLLVDVCIQRDAIGESADYFSIAESKFGAEKTMESLRAYIADSGIAINSELVSVCAAKQGDGDTILVSDRVGAEVRHARQPLVTDPDISQDTEYLQALSIVSTYAFERAALDEAPSDTEHKAVGLSKSDFLEAAAIIENRTGASSILFTGILGTSPSGGKAAAQAIGNVFIGFSTAVATAGLGTGYYLMFAPGHSFSGRFMEGALVDLESADISWSNAVKVPGDPMNQETWSSPDPIDLLLHDLLFQTTQ